MRSGEAGSGRSKGSKGGKGSSALRRPGGMKFIFDQEIVSGCVFNHLILRDCACHFRSEAPPRLPAAGHFRRKGERRIGASGGAEGRGSWHRVRDPWPVSRGWRRLLRSPGCWRLEVGSWRRTLSHKRRRRANWNCRLLALASKRQRGRWRGHRYFFARCVACRDARD